VTDFFVVAGIIVVFCALIIWVDGDFSWKE